MTRATQAAADRRNSNQIAGMKKRAARGSTALKLLRPGHSAEFSVVPGEDDKAYRDRLIAWTGDLGPRNRVELYLVEQAVRLSWQLDRADRAGLSPLSEPTRVDREPAPADATNPMNGLGIVRSDPGDRLKRHQLACSRMLLRTLETLAGLRQALAATASDEESAFLQEEDRSRLPHRSVARGSGWLGSSRPGRPATPPVAGTSGAGARPLGAAAAEAASDPSHPGVHRTGMRDGASQDPLGITPGSPCPIPDESEAPATLRDSADGLAEAADPADTPGRARPSMRRRVPKRRASQTEWPVSRRTGTQGPALDSRGTTARRGPQPPEASSDRPESRRRVGGYAVPLDPSVAVSFADRIPVRLRRQSAAARSARAASFPSE